MIFFLYLHPEMLLFLEITFAWDIVCVRVCVHVCVRRVDGLQV